MSPTSSRTAQSRPSAAARFVEVELPPSAGTRAAIRAERSARLPQFIGMPVDAGAVFDDLKLAVVAAGSVGRRIALSAARLQPHTLWIVDPARYKPESLLTQEIHPGDVGEAKASNTGRACKSISPETRVLAYDGRVQDLPRTAFLSTALVVMAPDNLETEADVAQRCLHLQKPLVQASLHGESMVAQVRFFGNSEASGPCAACSYGAREWSDLSAETIYSCSAEAWETGGAQVVEKRVVRPTVSTSFLSALAADLAMVQATRYLLRLGKSPVDTMLSYCGFTHATSVTPLVRNPECACEHIGWRQAAAPSRLTGCTLNDLVDRSGIEAGDGEDAEADLAFEVDDFTFVEAASCCGEVQPVGRFKRAGSSSPNCRHCRRPLMFDGLYEHSAVPADVIARDRPLESLGAQEARFVVIRSGQRATLFVNEDKPCQN